MAWQTRVHISIHRLNMEQTHKETSCAMNHTVSKLYRIVFWSARHLYKQLVRIVLIVGLVFKYVA